MNLTSKHEQVIFLACTWIYFIPIYRWEHFCTLDVLSRQSCVENVRVCSWLSQSRRGEKEKVRTQMHAGHSSDAWCNHNAKAKLQSPPTERSNSTRGEMTAFAALSGLLLQFFCFFILTSPKIQGICSLDIPYIHSVTQQSLLPLLSSSWRLHH